MIIYALEEVFYELMSQELFTTKEKAQKRLEEIKEEHRDYYRLLCHERWFQEIHYGKSIEDYVYHGTKHYNIREIEVK